MRSESKDVPIYTSAALNPGTAVNSWNVRQSPNNNKTELRPGSVFLIHKTRTKKQLCSRISSMNSETNTRTRRVHCHLLLCCDFCSPERFNVRGRKPREQTVWQQLTKCDANGSNASQARTRGRLLKSQLCACLVMFTSPGCTKASLQASEEGHGS